MAQGVDRGPLMDTACAEGSPEGVLYAAPGHGYGSCGHACPSAAWGGKEPDGMAVRFPVLAQPRQGRLWERHVAILGAFATVHMEKHACTVNLGDLQVGAFLKPQATGGDGGETHPIAQQFQVCENGADLFSTEDDREFLFPWGPDEGQRGPLSLQGVHIEKLDTAQGDGTWRCASNA